MIIILLSSICSKGLEDGFHSLTLSKGVHVFDFNSYDVFFRKNSNSSAIISIIDGNGTESDFFDVEADKFIRIYGSGVKVIAKKDFCKIDLLLIDKGMCNDFSVSLSFHTYINTTHVLTNESMSLCYIFFQPESDYRVNFDCLSLHRNTICSIHTNESLTGHKGPTTCSANSTCDTVISDGCLIVIKGANEIPIETSARIMMIKGKNQDHQCKLQKVSIYNTSGEYEPNFDNKFIYNCTEPSDSVLIAIILIIILVTIIIFSILIYSKCRPNRDAHKSDSDIIQRPKKPRHKHGSAFLAVNDNHLLSSNNV